MTLTMLMKSYFVWLVLSIVGLAVIRGAIELGGLSLAVEFAAVSIFGIAGVLMFARWGQQD